MNNTIKTTPAIHGGRPEDYFYTLGKTGTKTFHSIILECKIPKGEIDKRFIPEIKERPEVEKYKDVATILEKRKNIEFKIASLNNQVTALNDQLCNLGIFGSDAENQALKKLEDRTKEKAERRKEFSAERQAVLEGTFYANGWYYHGYSTGANLDPQHKNVQSPSIKSNYRPKPGNFNYEEDNSSSDEEFQAASHNTNRVNHKKEAHKSQGATPRILLDNSITTRKEWLIWLKDNHVDKGGDSDKCSDIISAGRERGW
jgi:hypothetical protein